MATTLEDSDRTVEAVLEDVLGGFVSAAKAATLYGVVVRDRAVDTAATAALRANRPATRRFHRSEYVDALT